MTTESKSTAERWQHGENWSESVCELKGSSAWEAKTFQNTESEQVWPDVLGKVIDARLCKAFLFMRSVALGYQYLFSLLAMCCRNNPRRQRILL